MAELYILGPAEIRNIEGELEQSFLAGPKRLALLIYMLLHRPHGFLRRDSLLPLFWPEHGQKSARNALSNMLYHIRRTLGSDSIINRGTEEVSIRSEAFWTDALTFEENMKGGNIEKALDLYRGDLLKGFYIPEASPEFEQWLDQERDRFCTLATEGAWALAEKAEQQKDYAVAQKWARKAAKLNPLCDHTHARLMDLLDRMGSRKAALEVYQEFSSRFQKEWECAPPAELMALADEIQRKGLAAPYLSHISSKAATNKVSAGSIAVLPFETLGLEKATAFTDAIHGDILTRLSNVADLRVTSRTSVMKFRNPQRLLPHIARELGVEWVLSGEVQEATNRIQVSVRLVKAHEDSQVWGESYWKELTADNLFQIQADITNQIAEALETRLTTEEKSAIEQSQTKDLESYCLHAQGRWSLDQRTEKGIRDALNYFQQAISRDPDYVLAWVGLTDALVLLFEYGFADGETVFPEAEKAVQRALDLGPEVAEVNASLALLHEARREGPAAIKKYRQAIALRPNYAEAHNWLSWTSQLLGDSEEALQSAKRAVELNPLSQEALSNLSLSWLTNGDYEKALSEARRIQHIQPNWTTANFYEGVALYHQGKFQEAANVLENLSVPWAGSGPLLTWALAKVGICNSQESDALMCQVTDNAEAFSEALMLAALGKKDEAFTALQKVDDWNYWAVLAIHHLYPEILNPLRKDVRFVQVLEKVKKSWGISDLS